MPFTLSHPAVIIPLRYIGKKYFSVTGLVIGSIIPDFEYFLRIENRSRFSHTWSGIFWFDLPLGLLVSFLFHNIVKSPFIANSPYSLYSKIEKYDQFNWNQYFKANWIKVIYSIIIGVITHIISDKLTHKSSNLVSAMPGIIETQELIDTPKSIYRIIQITFSIIGLLLCSFVVWQMPRNTSINNFSPNYWYWILVCSFFSIMLALIIFKKGYEGTDLIVSAMSSILGAFLVTSLILLPDKKLVLVRKSKRKSLTSQ